MEDINAIIEEERSKINVNIGADSDGDEDVVFSENEVAEAGHSAAAKKKERLQADKERDDLLNAGEPIIN